MLLFLLVHILSNIGAHRLENPETKIAILPAGGATVAVKHDICTIIYAV